MNVDTDPFEAGLGRFIRHDKSAEFIGQQAARRLAVSPRRRRLVTLTFDLVTDPGASGAIGDPCGNEAIWYGDRVVGNTTSGTYGQTVGRSLAFGYVPSELTVVASRSKSRSSADTSVVEVELVDGRRSAVVNVRPALPPNTTPTPSSGAKN